VAKNMMAEVQASEELPEDDPEGDENPSGGQETGPGGGETPQGPPDGI
jgi:hypothetical protein